MPNVTNRQIISDIINDLRAVNLDDRVPKRFIYNKLCSYAAFHIKRDADARRILFISDLWTDVPCVEMCFVPLVDCCNIDIPNCKTVAKSKKKIPDVYETLYKELIQVFNPLYDREFKQTDPQQYKNLITREYVDKRIKYFWMSGGHIIIPDALVDTITIRGVFPNPAEALKLNSCENSDEKLCVSLLDQPFVCPDYLLAVVKQTVLQDLFNYYKRNVLDEVPNLNTNIKANEKQ